MGSKRPLKQSICFITSSKEIKKMRNPRRLCSVNRKPIHCAGWAQLCGGVGRKGKGQVPLPAHSHHIPDGLWVCLLQPHKPRARNAHLNGENNCCSLSWSYQALQDMKGWSTAFCIWSPFNQSKPSAHRATLVRNDNWNDSVDLPGFLQQFPSISSSALKYRCLSAQW